MFWRFEGPFREGDDNGASILLFVRCLVRIRVLYKCEVAEVFFVLHKARNCVTVCGDCW